MASFSVDPHHANLQSHLLFNFPLCFNPTSTFLGFIFDRTLSFSKHVSSLKAKFFPCLKALRCISALSWGSSEESVSLLYKAFLRPLLTYASPGWFPFLSAPNLTKLKCLYLAVSLSITGCLSFPPVPFFLSEAFLSPLGDFAPSSYKRAVGLPTSFSISDLARLKVKLKLSNPPGELLRPLNLVCFLLLLPGKIFLHALSLLIKTFLPSL